MYALLKPFLFSLDAETGHNLTLAILSKVSRSRLLCASFSRSLKMEKAGTPTNVMGLTFPNDIGLAAGLDKHANAINAFAAMGFGFLEVGTVTPEPQSGNPKPRMFRLKEHQAIINRMGFNSVGLNQFLINIKHRRTSIPIGINLGKNATTPIKNAVNDYLIGMQRVYEYADYLTINISSPNTKNLRELQQDEALDKLLGAIKTKQQALIEQHNKTVPLAVKIAPDLNDEQIQSIADLSKRHGFDAIIATNTTLARPAIAGHKHENEAGGLSGMPMREMSDKVVIKLCKKLDSSVELIGAGGVMSSEDAQTKRRCGANLVQLYTGFIYRGPKLISECIK